jgi:hypothetical protein
MSAGEKEGASSSSSSSSSIFSGLRKLSTSMGFEKNYKNMTIEDIDKASTVSSAVSALKLVNERLFPGLNFAGNEQLVFSCLHCLIRVLSSPSHGLEPGDPAAQQPVGTPGKQQRRGLARYACHLPAEHRGIELREDGRGWLLRDRQLDTAAVSRQGS